MAATRKLQGEIDRCLKKVTEGVDTFEDIWQKVHNATNSNQKEKYEADLKKEIKKLQRLRDQIKSWIASAEIKDKSSLLENRRLIETQMERFKVVERETKTKAYSKEGLGAAQKLDPAQRVKDELRQWLTTSISALQIQIDQYESEIESLLAGKKKRLDKDKQDRMDELRAKLDRHKFHITKLETLLRMLDNDGVDVEQVRRIKDDVEYYIESSQDPDFEENEYIYDDIIGLDEVELSGTGIPSTTDSNNSNDTADSPSSLISGSSPVVSPTLNYSLNFNHSSESTSEFNDKKHKSENAIGSKITPVKPTAVRANKSETGSSISTSMLLPQNKPIVCSTPSKNQTQTNALSGVSALNVSGIQQPTSSSTTGSTPNTGILNTVIASSQNLQHHTTTLSSLTTTPQQSSNTLVPTTAPIAFAAVAKHNTSQQQTAADNLALMRQYSAFASTTSSVSSGTTPAAVSTHNAQNLQHSSVINAMQAVSNPHTSVSHVVPPSSTTLSSINSSNNNNHTLNSVSTSQHQSHSLVSSSTGLTNVLDNNHSTFTSVANSLPTTLTFNNSVINSVSPVNSVVSSRASPSIMSPKAQPPQQQQQQQQHQQSFINGSTLSNQQFVMNPFANTDSLSTLKTIAQEAINRAAGLESSISASMPPPQPPGTTLSDTRQTASLFLSSNDSANLHSNGTNEAHIPPLLGVAPLGPCPLKKEHQLQFQMMEAADYHLPTPSDSERLKTYLHRQPVPTPSHYPQTQLPHSDTVEFFQRLSTETLFFVFYYMEGTKAQYLAAKALKKQSWRFHTKYMMWFQRHEEPKIINEEYEQGTYIYFDYEKWAQRKKEGFTFEYKYLEDRDLN